MHPAKTSHASPASLSWIAVPQGAISVLMCPGPFPVAGSDDSDPAQLSRWALNGWNGWLEKGAAQPICDASNTHAAERLSRATTQS